MIFYVVYAIIEIRREGDFMNDLAKKVDECIQKRGVKKTWIAEQLGISQQLLNKRLNKKNFTIEDANEILRTFGYKTDVNIIPFTINEAIQNLSGFTEIIDDNSNKKRQS